MVSIKKIFGSGGDSNATDDGGDLRHRNSRTSLDRSGKEGEAKSKNDELAARLSGKSSTDKDSSLGHRKSLSNSSTTGLHNNSTSNSNRNSTTGYNTEAAGTGAGLGAGAAGLGAASLGTAAVGANSVDRDSVKTSDIVHATPENAHATVSGERPIVGAIPVHSGKGMSASNNPEFVLPAGVDGSHHNAVHERGLGSVDNGLRDNSNKESFTEAPHHGSGIAAVAPKREGLERTGTGRLGKSASGRGFENPHESGHLASAAHHEFDPKLATHDHQHLQHVTHREVRHVEVEEVERQREVDRHIHHVQTHVQPVLDKKILPEKITENIVPQTKVHEKHASTAEDVALFESLATAHKDTETHRAKERTVVDLGEKVTENVHHHVHHVTQPVIEQEIVERHRIHTVIPVHHTTHEAPIIHKSSTHAPVALEDFLKGGGIIGSDKTYDNVGLLPDHDCDRSVDGVAEKLVKELNLSTSGTHYNGSHDHGSHSHGSTTGSHTLGSNTGSNTLGSTTGDNITHANTGDRVGSTEKI